VFLPVPCTVAISVLVVIEKFKNYILIDYYGHPITDALYTIVNSDSPVYYLVLFKNNNNIKNIVIIINNKIIIITIIL